MSYLKIHTRPNTQVTIINNTDNYSFEDYTDNNGLLEFRQIPLGEYTVTCKKEGYRDYTCPDTIIIDNTTRKITATRGLISVLETSNNTLNELIINTKTPETLVTLKGTEVYYKTTNNQGIAVFNDIPYNTYTITVEKPGYYTYNTSTLINESNNDPRELIIRLNKVEELIE